MLPHYSASTRLRTDSTSFSPGSGVLARTGWDWRQRLSRGSAKATLPLGDSPATRTPKLARLEAALFVADRAFSLKKLVQLATLADAKEALALIEQLNQLYDDGGSAFRIERVAAGHKMFTRPKLAKWLDRIHDRQAYMKLSPPAMETLSIIAYRQPCTRADVEAVRGVQAAEMIKQLMEKNLVRVVGEDDSLGRPFLYGTTKLFLESYGLTNLNELPMAEELAPTVQTEDEEELPPEEPSLAEGKDDPEAEDESVEMRQAG